MSALPANFDNTYINIAPGTIFKVKMSLLKSFGLCSALTVVFYLATPALIFVAVSSCDLVTLFDKQGVLRIYT